MDLDQKPSFFMVAATWLATAPCLDESWFWTIWGMFPFKSASEMYVTLV